MFWRDSVASDLQSEATYYKDLQSADNCSILINNGLCMRIENPNSRRHRIANPMQRQTRPLFLQNTSWQGVSREKLARNISCWRGAAGGGFLKKVRAEWEKCVYFKKKCIFAFVNYTWQLSKICRKLLACMFVVKCQVVKFGHENEQNGHEKGCNYWHN